MQEFLTYNLKVSVCIAAFYLFYKLLLSRETFHRLNRAVLVGVTVLSFVLPVWRVTVYRHAEVVPMQTAVQPVAELPSETSAAIDWWIVGGVLFAAGVAVVLLRMAVSVGAVVRIIREGRHERIDSQSVLVRLSREVAPFSWIRWIVVSERDLAENGDAIVAHERAHIRLRHSYDLLATDLLATLQWFNPAMWLLRAELRAVHEYEADAAVLAGGADAREYQMLLIEKAVGGKWCSVANSLNHSKLKNRITMMLRKKSSRWAMARVLFVVPLVCVAAAAFARTVVVPVEDKVTENFSIGEIASDKPQTDETPQAEREASSDKKIVVRYTGNASFTNAKTPVWIVDGREVTEEEAKTIPSNEIESVTVLKDKIAVELYGERAVNGVIKIKTKKEEGKSDIKTLHSAVSSGNKPVEYYVDGKKVSKEEFRAMSGDSIANMNIDKFDGSIRIDITTKKN